MLRIYDVVIPFQIYLDELSDNTYITPKRLRKDVWVNRVVNFHVNGDPFGKDDKNMFFTL